MTQYKEILSNLENGKCPYMDSSTGEGYVLGNGVIFKINLDSSFTFFNSLEQMARSINKWLKQAS